MNETFAGLVNVKIYFGTKFDDINVPYHMGLVQQQATKIIERPSQIVWQSTFLEVIDIDIEDYQEIVGAQYVEIIDVGTENHGTHWFTVQSYTQIAQKTVRLGLLYDPLLTIGIHHITAINGTMQRWTVSDDTHFNYIYTPEPISQADNFNYSYYRIHHTTGGERNLAGFPYDMTKAPNIISYESAGSSPNANIYYPQLSSATGSTQFVTAIGSQMTIRDGLLYYGWAPLEGNIIYENYSKAIGLGHEMVCNGYILPISDLITVTGSGNGYQTITGGSNTYSTGMGLYDGGCNNAKASEVGVSFVLYNEVSGDAVQIDNFNLTNTSIFVACNPYCTGRFYARFAGYMGNTSGFSGLVKSPGYRGLSIASSEGYGVTANLLANAMQVNSMETGINNQIRSAYLSEANTELRADYQASEGEYGLHTIATASSTGLPSLIDIGGRWNSWIDAAPSGIASPASLIQPGFSVRGEADLQRRIANRELSTALINLNNMRNAQRQMLSSQGDITRSTPPAFKFAMSSDIMGNTYDFCVRRATFSARDRQRIDNFFTAYGYNVDNTPLNSPTQLHNRTKFTFIQATDVNILGVSGGTDLTRLRDWRTVEMIKERFATGLRIWYSTDPPDYDWSKSNPIGGAN